ncbi:MAG: hypothetical protein QG574_4866 [Cyanobacteriota bacterium erpe_2018_sw_21hr_WHONDRS-SW48-000092_B_bin.40]|jgi:hypothetical protein|nr:hypothetical protein [Cyanobacteriota bacterium erpe_2018_sw_21hr_WHONDRS-SW48-000092_B_bin.40]
MVESENIKPLMASNSIFTSGVTRVQSENWTESQIEKALKSSKLAEMTSQPVFGRLWKYYADVATSLSSSSSSASIFPNTTDIGASREWIYAKFLKNHLPSICDIFFGGFLYGSDGTESKQMDVIVTSNLSQRFRAFEEGKSFACVDGSIAAVCIKSTLNTRELINSLENLASIPSLCTINKEELSDYEKLPVKIIYAPDGMSGKNLFEAIYNFYETNSNIPYRSKPDIIHVNKKYVFIKAAPTQAGHYLPLEDSDGSFGLIHATHLIQDRILTSAKLEIGYMQPIVPLLKQGKIKIVEL